jgi:hypothetical protein
VGKSAMSSITFYNKCNVEFLSITPIAKFKDSLKNLEKYGLIRVVPEIKIQSRRANIL